MSLAAKLYNPTRTAVRATSYVGVQIGTGAGKGGSTGGSIRDAGGAFGRLEAAREEEYFYHLQKHQLKTLRDQLKKEIEHHEGQMRNHWMVVERHKQRIEELAKEEQAIAKPPEPSA
ncbi:hypothetical protein PMAYCL1PPCAC_20611 [Pristionchus mayeri]|uniref:ATPase inhibitor, mitochondrial n=1 Tax=Pristionchus mayeri TaxID=1317129 RepID=A0AAN5I4E3_9BILA|nr:hypothetical protein PMAYCL1PPCAC_20611 [Pristionchus mayeri]